MYIGSDTAARENQTVTLGIISVHNLHIRVRDYYNLII